ncbi:MAG: hypothetical protein ABSH39_23045 [Candidatus Acidiferrum sp.]|jgi:hypothetical protein
MRKTLKSIAGIVLGIAFGAAIISLVFVALSLFGGHLGDVNETAASILGASIGAILAAGILWTLIEIADTIAAANDRKL